MARSFLPLAALLTLAGCENRDRLSDAEASAAAVQPANELIVPESGVASATMPDIEPGELVYKALGTEPGWTLAVREGAMLYQGDNGRVRIMEATPPGFRPLPGRVRSGRLTVTIARGPCNDGMSDHVWRDRVTVLVTGGETASGCGGGLITVVDPNAIEGTRYRITALNGAAIRQPDRWWLSFADGRISGQFGCGNFSGSYRRNGDHLGLTSPLVQSSGRCSATAAWDQAAQRVLSSNLRIEKAAGIVRLVSEVGTIELSSPPQEIPTA